MNKRDLGVLTIALFLLAFGFQGSRGIFGPDEGRYTNVAMEMIRLGDWMHPHRHAETLHLTKPPLTYWAIAGSVSVFGRNEWAARLPNALAFVLTGLCIYGMATRLVSQRAWLPPLIYATSLLPFVASNIVTTDTLLTLWESAAGLCFIQGWWSLDKAIRRRWIEGMWGAFGLAFLTKGPPGLLPLAGFFVFVFLSGQKHEWRDLLPIKGLGLFALTGFTWYIVLIVQDPGLFRYFFVEEVFNRIATDSHNRYGQWYGAFYVYAPAFLLGSFPWGLVPIYRARTVWRRFSSFRYRRERTASPELLVATCWILVPLAVFFISQSRMTLYILPLLVPLSLIEGHALRNWTFSRRRGRWLAAWMLVLLTLKGAAAYFPHERNARPFAEVIEHSISFRPQEITFIDTSAKYGLGFYLDCEVEAVKSGKGERLRSIYDSSLDHEIAEAEENVVWITKSDNVERVVQEMREAGRSLDIVNTYLQYSILTKTLELKN